VVIRSCWDYHLHHEDFLRWTARAGERVPVVNSPELLRWNSDKRYLLELEAAGFPIPRLVPLPADALSYNSPAALVSAHAMKNAILKPAISASAYGTFLRASDDRTPFHGRMKTLLSERAMLLQEFVPEIRTRGEWSLVFLGGQFSHAAQKRPAAGDFRVQRELGGSAEAMPAPAGGLALATRLVERFASGALYSRVDLVESAQGWLVMELELIEPELFFRMNPTAPQRFAELALAAAGALERTKEKHG
jgi:glutathione synthase/RimK-type ligase-like ATP-grasp enzyme